jgi:hypothetical protein
MFFVGVLALPIIHTTTMIHIPTSHDLVVKNEI